MARKTLFEEMPDRFVLPGRAKGSKKPLPALVFKRDESAPGVTYRAKVTPADLGLEELEPKKD